MTTVGETLREHRKKGDLALEEISERTEIKREFLEALERGKFEDLPGRAIAKFYIRAYGDLLDFDPQPLIVEFETEWRKREREAPFEHRRKSYQPPALDAEELEAAEATGAAEDVPPPPLLLPRPVETTPEVYAQDGRAGSRSGQAAGLALVKEFPSQEQEAPQADELTTAASTQEESVPVQSTTLPPVVAKGALLPLTLLGEGRRRAVVAAVIVVVGLLIVLAWATGGEGEPLAPVVELPREFVVEKKETPSTDLPESRPMETPTPVRVSALVEDPGVEPDAGSAAALPGAEREPTQLADRRPTTIQRSSPAAPESSQGGLNVAEFGVGRRVVDRRLEGQTDRFAEGSVAWFSTRVLGGERGQSIRHVWLREGQQVESIELDLGGPHWRTHSRKTLWRSGSWAVEAWDQEGRVLARATFTCEK